ncbi:MAG: MBL fold metallo-hydrolase [Clostridia bacterium]|nr:MBL fold metallo-hydrolase [Clostridia bacterium]
MEKIIQYSTTGSRFNGEWKWQAAGMCYIIVTEHRHLIVIDGGSTAEDARNIIGICRTETGSTKPEIDMWILTHPHIDHIGAFAAIGENEELRREITVKKVVFSAPDTYVFKNPARKTEKEVAMMKSAVSLLEADFYEPVSGDCLETDGVLTDILFTYRDLEKAEDPNELSMVFRISGKNKSAMFTGDSYFAGLDVVYKKHRDNGTLTELSSDIVQTAHHSLNGGHTMFYKAVGAEIALVPISRPGDEAMNLPEENCAHHNMYARRLARTVILAYTGTASVEI